MEPVKRDLLRVIARSELPEDNLGVLLNNCFEWMQSADEPPSTKVHSMQIVYNVSQYEPDIKPELISIIEDQMPKNSVGYKNRGSKLLKKLYMEISRKK